MDSTLQKKLLLGSVYKAHRKAKMYGTICLMNVDLLDIILDLANHCQLTLDFTTQKCLEKMARDLQNKDKDICSYRNKKINDTKFIN
tara:strand:+ start:18898 stop:19158 length:261 start_codon:yes stop_codon:yes gene_type:complete